MRELKNQPNLLRALFGAPVVAAAFMLCASPSHAALPPAAQASFDTAMIAARQQEWQIAVRDLQEARKAAPDAPEIFYNLGLAESKLPGRELRAEVWFSAYLMAEPNAPNAAAVRQAIAELDVRNQGGIVRLVKLCEQAAARLPDAPVHQFVNLWGKHMMTRADETRNAALAKVELLLAASGDGDAARQIAHRLREERNEQSDLADIAEAQANAGRTADAVHTVEGMSEDPFREGALLKIGQAYARAGDFPAADAILAQVRNEARAMSDDNLKGSYMFDITVARSGWLSDAEVEANDLGLARRTLSEAAQNAQEVGATRKAVALTRVGEAQAKIGDIAGARVTLAAAIGAAPAPPKDDAWDSIAWLQADIGDLAGARRSIAAISDEGTKEIKLRLLDDEVGSIAVIQADAGDLPGALRTAAAITHRAEAENVRYALTALYHVKKADLDAARPTPAQDASYPAVLQVRIARDQAERGHYALAQQIAAGIAEPQYRLVAQRDVSASAKRESSMTPGDLATMLDRDLADPVFLDPAGALETLPAGDPQKMFDAMYALVSEAVNRTNDVDQRLKKQAPSR